MAPKVGRPEAENPKINGVKVRFANDELEKLDKYCKEHHVTRSDAIRAGLNLLFDKK